MTGRSAECDQVLTAIMATLDGEEPSLSQGAISSHLERCSACAAEAAGLAAVHARLGTVRYDGPRVDLWPNVAGQLDEATNRRREWMAIAVVAAVCAAWRTAQLVLELPLPILNGAIPLVTVALIIAWVIGDPLAIKITPELRQERA
jgi:anti-sigma factor RsiW